MSINLSTILFLIVAIIFTACGGNEESPSITSIKTTEFPAAKEPSIDQVIWPYTVFNTGLGLKLSDDIAKDIEGEVDSDNHTLMDFVAGEWNKASPHHTFFKLPLDIVANKELTDLRQYRDDELGIYKSYEWFEMVSSSVIAITQYFARRPLEGDPTVWMTHADIIINYKDFTFSTDPNDKESYYLPTIVIHEMGHLLGLPHSEYRNGRSVMLPYSSPRYDFKTLYPNDVDAINTKYPEEPPIPRENEMFLSNIYPSDNSKFERGDETRGIIELRAGGECVHKINGKVVRRHWVKLN